MKIKRYILPLLSAVLLFSACKKEELVSVTLSASLEQPTPEEGSNAKNYLHNEEFIFWELGDAIRISGTENEERFVMNRLEHVGAKDAMFVGDLTIQGSGEPKMYAVYPFESYSSLGEDNSGFKIKYPKRMPYRVNDLANGEPADTAANPDMTFGQNCFPMVAEFTVHNSGAGARSHIDFHSVSGLVRFHLYSSSEEVVTIDSIQFTSVDKGGNYISKQISGEFTLNDIATNAPFLTSNGTVPDANKAITITGINKTIGGGNEGNFLTFYLPLPAQNAGTAGGSSEQNRTYYALEMKVMASKGEGDAKVSKTFTKTMGVQVQRNTMMKMQALDITSWDGTTTQGGATIGLVGNGTQERPFQIYTGADLKLVRDAFNTAATANTEVKINGQTVSENTYFKIMRSDIVLGQDDIAATANEPAQVKWESGIKGFKGHMTGSMSNATQFGITNNSHAPLFESISDDGQLHYITVRCDGTLTYSGTADFSPLCITNNGTMDNCHNRANVTASQASVAGLCVTNVGRITSGANEGLLTATNEDKVAAGHCLYNHGTLQGFSIASANVRAINSAGVCYRNYFGAEVSDCVEAVQLTNFGETGMTVTAGGIVHTNEGTVSNCRVNGLLELVDGNECAIGGIVFRNTGTVDNCIVTLALRNAHTLGGIVKENEGTITNCGLQLGATLTATHLVGGIVAELKAGSVMNCYNKGQVGSASAETSEGTFGYIVGKMGATSISTIVLNNVYTSVGETPHFYGSVENDNNATITLTNCYGLVAQTYNSGSVVTAIGSLTNTGVVGGIEYTNPLAYILNKNVNEETALSGMKRWTDAEYPVFVENTGSKSRAATPSHRRSNADRIAAARAGGRR